MGNPASPLRDSEGGEPSLEQWRWTGQSGTYLARGRRPCWARADSEVQGHCAPAPTQHLTLMEAPSMLKE